MIGIVIVGVSGPRKRPWWKRRERPSLRAIATAVVRLQEAEGMKLHATRDQCSRCKVLSEAARDLFGPLIPAQLMRDPEWVHRHIEAPGIRIQARLEDRMAGR